SKATSLGGGIYHYEYAVYNQNSDRNGGSFSVPIPAGASISNIGFRDGTYRNGDGPGNVNISGTDWVGTVMAGAIVWETETEAANPSANAIRWASTHNFRFDANVAPTNSLVTLGLWKPGSPTSVTAAAEVPSVGAPIVLAYCFGNGTGTVCPCANPGAAGNGCANSVNAAGANLGTLGTPSISADTFVLSGSGMPNSSALYFQGTSQANAGAGTVFGDGLRCAAGSVIRLGTKTNAAVKGANVAGNVRTYQCWYRNAAAFCTVDTFNLTNGVQATWQP
ncbi:MAG: hypothetical protein NTY35_00190, partial [Planctomycetota bacterium]|nr:hypothetical protein [Planctomycetota bacterium]